MCGCRMASCSGGAPAPKRVSRTSIRLSNKSAQNSLTVVLLAWDEHTDAAAQPWSSFSPKSPSLWRPGARNHKNDSLQRNLQSRTVTEYYATANEREESGHQQECTVRSGTSQAFDDFAHSASAQTPKHQPG